MQQLVVALVTALLLTGTVGVLGGTNAVVLDADSTSLGAELLDGTDPLAADTDEDGIDDDEERKGGTDPTLADTDSDGLPDGEERDGPTDPTSADTDADEINDGTERAGLTDPDEADTDGDGLNDGRELELGTNATLSDTDGDDLNDRREVNWGSNPTLGDTDRDGLGDAREANEGLDPTKTDTDGDGLGDEREVNSTALDGTLADTDDDGLGDGAELSGLTDPATPDTDGDQLTDGREAELGTNGTIADTDGDDHDDGEEVQGETRDGVAIPDADPLRMDLFVQVYVDAESAAPSSYEAIQNDWAEMPVPNPDGSTGITLHVEQKRLDEAYTFDGSSGSFRDILWEGRTRAGGAYGPYRVVMFVQFDAGRNVGMARIGGHFSIVNGDRPDPKQRTAMNHELLHNVVGRIEDDGRCPDDPAHYCDGGWLEPTTNSKLYLPEPIGEEIAESGFED